MTAKVVKEELEANYAAIEQAFRTKDAETVRNFMSADFVAHPPQGGILTREDVMRSVERQFAELDIASFDRRVKTLDIRDHTATVTAQALFQATKLTPSREEVELHLTNEDTWALTPDGWRMVASRAIN